MIPKPVRVIFVERYTPNKPEFFPSPDSDHFYLASWGGMFARRIVKSDPREDVEVWRTERGFHEIYERTALGVKCLIFPHKHFLFAFVTWAMLARLKLYSRKYQLIIHRNSIVHWPFVLGISCLFPRARIVLSHHGGRLYRSPSFKYRLRNTMIAYSFSKIDTLTYLRAGIRDLALSVKHPPKLRFLPVGADFDAFYPEDKQICRKELGLEQNKVYAVYVGKFYRLKGVDHLLRALDELRKENLEVLFVGGNPQDELFGEVEACGSPYWKYVDWSTLRKIYSAADFYLHPAFSEDFGGLDVSWMECLACNRPVVSPQLTELDFPHQDLGIALRSPEDLLVKTREMMSTYMNYHRCRQAAGPHLDGNKAIVRKLREIYYG